MLVTQGKVNSFIATVPTRWGTQVRQIFSILRAQVPLESYTRHPEASEKWSAILRDSDWWQNSRALYRILEPIHSSQMMSESNRASLAKVYPRWLKIDSHFRQNQLPHSGPWWYDLQQYCARIGPGSWESRMKKHLLPIHLAAYILLPENQHNRFNNNLMLELEDWIIKREQGAPLYSEYCQYISLEGPFNVTRVCWQMFKDKPKEFWMSTVSIIHSLVPFFTNVIQRMEAPHLSQLALELFHTTANSVASERAF